jgi:RimJ/RimL family protein N-acetyltransferase
VAKSLKEDIHAERDFDLWPVLERGNDQLIGHCGIIDKEVESGNEYEIVYMLSKSAWGKGYATEAAAAILDYAYKQLGLRRIIALIRQGNTKSEKVAVKIGLRYEKDTIRANGEIMKVYALNV